MTKPSPEQRQELLRSEGRNVGGENESWCVYEMPPAATDASKRSSLIFESAKIVRRVREFPPHWRDLSDEALYALSHSL